jgi:hypothetical protein
MSQNHTLTDTPAEALKSGMGSPVQSFGTKEQGIWVHRKEILGTLVMLALGGWVIYGIVSGILYLGIDYYFRERTENLF